MEEYREKIKLQNISTGVSAFILAVFAFIATLGEAGIIPWLNPIAGDSHWQSKWRGFICGAAFGLLVFMIVGIIRNIRALHNEKALKKLYVKENDERTEQITRSAQAAAYRTAVMLGLVAVIVAGYFNVTVSITILVCLWVAALLGPVYKLYYSKKF